MLIAIKGVYNGRYRNKKKYKIPENYLTFIKICCIIFIVR